MKTFPAVLLIVAATLIVGQEPKRHRDVDQITDVSKPQPDVQVFSSAQLEQIGTRGEAIADIKDRLRTVEDSLKDIKSDVKALTETNTIVKFLATSFQILVPGMAIAAFST